MKKYNLLIPLAGKGQRFLDKGVSIPKYIITAKDKHLIDWAMQSINYTECNLIFCLRQDHINNFGVDEIFKNKFGKNITIVAIDKITDGSVSTCLLAEEYINNDLPLYIYCVDVTFTPTFTPTIIHDAGKILTFKSNSPSYSYVKLDQDKNVVLAAEKEVISNNACVGLYGFKSGRTFVQFAKKMIDANIRTRDEFYITPLYNLMVDKGYKISTQEVDQLHIMGTPEEYKFFTTRTLNKFGDKPIALVSDHSGYDLKEQIKESFIQQKLEFIDLGCFVKKDCDQYDYVSQAVQFIKDGTCGYGIGICKTGQAMNMCANKSSDIRSALIYDEYVAEYAIKHNCANFFAIPSRITTKESFDNYLSIWLNTSFEGGRHCARIMKIEGILK